MAKGYKIATRAQRDKLPARREPYWTRLIARGFLGFRRTTGGGTWVARYNHPRSAKHPNGFKEYNALKLPVDVPEDEARDAAAKLALKWFDAIVSGAVKAGAGGYRVSDAAMAYIAHLRAHKGDVASKDAEGRINRTLKASLLWERRLDRLTSGDIREWLQGLVPAELEGDAARKAKASANRNLTTLKAALNLAWSDGRVASPTQWRRVEAFENVERSRRTFLNLEQRRRLLDNCDGAFRDLIEAAMLTGARYGELRELKVEDFDKAGRVLEIHKGKTGRRTVALSDAAAAFFSRVTRDKLPSAALLARPDGKPWAHSDQDKLMREAVKKARLPAGTVFYTLRHSFIATALKEARIDIASVAKNCGTSVPIIERTYAKFIPGDISAKLNEVEFA